ncbi:MAG: chaperonin GroEL, partial [Romboutsia sp.]|nr:chaperonin GroEL [Romboutsia sp.]
ATEVEMKEKKARVEDALHATRAAVEEGIVPGGGVALLLGREAITKTREELDSNEFHGKDLVYKACGKPFIKILSNAGHEEQEIYSLLTKLGSYLQDNGQWSGFNIKTGDFGDFKELGIIDPTRVVKIALQNAASVAGTILLTETVIVEEKKTENNDNMLQNLM